MTLYSTICVGLFIGAYPCGIVGLFDELYNSEGLKQVHGILMDYMKTVSDMTELEYIIYDDACHLAKYSMNSKVSSKNKTTKFFSQRKFLIDRFHFRNHVDSWCHENCDPNEFPELLDVNTQICEQTFSRINQKKNCKSMNEPHFILYWLYNLDLNNLESIGMDRTEPNPLCEFRWSQVEEKLAPPTLKTTNIDDIVDQFSDVSLKNESFKCPSCPARYENSRGLTKHKREKHGEVGAKSNICSELCGEQECGKTFSSSAALRKHVENVHRSCSVCKETSFASHNEMVVHAKIHTVCQDCQKDFLYPSKLKQHVTKKHS